MPPSTPQASSADASEKLGRPRRWVSRLFGPFWVVPSLWCLGAVAAGLLLPELEQAQPSWFPLLFQGGATGARSLLSTIAGAMISVTGLVFSITIVALQLASSQFSPRVLRTFLDDRIPQNALGVFAASFLYALTVLRSVIEGTSARSETVPQLAITMAYVLVLGSVAMFLWFIHHITLSISVGSVITEIGLETRAMLGRRTGDESAAPGEARPLQPYGEQSVAVAVSSGVLDVIDVATLCRVARQHDVRIEVLHRLGTFVPEGAPLAMVHGGAATEDWDTLVSRGLELASERSMRQDVSYGLRQLVDVAERALSPGINDPTTAVQVIDQLHDLLRRLGAGRDLDGLEADADGVVRLVTRPWGFGDLLDLAVDEIAHWGADGIQVPRRLEAMFDELAVGVQLPFRGIVVAKRQQLRLS
ncbi:MAG: DUF2254 domain-containing protein [Marmoricola sp.]